ncbi:MAG: hypothetical protein QM597_07430 [Aeromicrobium sp.]|uniref:hypothetical protein n=1 Tax=Aeromicrobium sp. TaxID=1871063 RepID=UPI0039E37DB5
MNGRWLGVAALAALAACTGANEGGETTCGEFLAQSESARIEVVKTLLDEADADDSDAAVALTRMTTEAYCRNVGTEDDQVRDVIGKPVP